ncbi:MAG: anthranilate synthase component I [Dehalococcoidia bacterium]|nr:anthranilate synthase component I [Dehalococcoidia bacterium]
MHYPTLEQVKKLASQGNLIPVYQEVIADLETPVSAYLKLTRTSQSKYSFLLESIEGGERIARYSFLGSSPDKVIIAGKAFGATTSTNPKVVMTDGADPLKLIQKELEKNIPVKIDGLPRFLEGAVGYLGYENIRHFENIPSPANDPQGLPEAFFMLTDTLLVFDHLQHKIKVVSHVHTDGNIEKEYEKATARIDELVQRLTEPLQTLPARTGGKPSGLEKAQANVSKEHFMEMVKKVKQYIHEGEVIQTVVSQRLTRKTTAAPFDIYRNLRTINPSPYMFYLDLGDVHIIGASPEMLVRVEDGYVHTHPIAGTRIRGATPEKDLELEHELKNDPKERAEHIMLVDLGRNDVGRVSEPGTVTVAELMHVERYSHVMHLVSKVSGKLRKGLTAYDAFRACFPAGTLSGAPKIRAMQTIAELEPDKRGTYGGAVGYFTSGGNMDTAIAIRTIAMKNGVAYIQAGAGIVFDSVPELEYQESLNKAAATLKAIDAAEGVA